MTEKHDCSEKAYRRLGNWGEWVPCRRSATVERNGKWYYWQHDPERVKAEAKKRRADWDAKVDREDAKYARIARNARLGKLVTPELAELLERLAWYIDTHKATGSSQATYTARALAARIREVLEVTE